MATRGYMESQNYDVTLGGVVYNVTVDIGTGSYAPALHFSDTATADDTTPTVQGVSILYLPANTGATAITQLDDGAADQIVVLVCTSDTNSPTIANSGNFELSAAWAPGVNDTLTLLTADGSTWLETSRSNNA